MRKNSWVGDLDMEKKTKERQQFRLPEALVDQLNVMSNNTGKTKTLIIEEALSAYFNQDEQIERTAAKVIELYDKKYRNHMTRVRMGVRTADINSQVLVEICNTLLLLKKINGNDFIGTDDMESPIVRKAKESINERIRKAKQEKDSKGK